DASDVVGAALSVILRAQDEQVELPLRGGAENGIAVFRPAIASGRSSLLQRFRGCFTYRGDAGVVVSAAVKAAWATGNIAAVLLIITCGWQFARSLA
ncbi:MAG: hypothetical protein ACKO2P_10430, partial [Planctomycetota bacterium]